MRIHFRRYGILKLAGTEKVLHHFKWILKFKRHNKESCKLAFGVTAKGSVFISIGIRNVMLCAFSGIPPNELSSFAPSHGLV